MRNALANFANFANLASLAVLAVLAGLAGCSTLPMWMVAQGGSRVSDHRHFDNAPLAPATAPLPLPERAPHESQGSSGWETWALSDVWGDVFHPGGERGGSRGISCT